MTVSIVRSIAVDTVSSVYGVKLSSANVKATLVYDIEAINVVGGVANITLSLTINGIVAGFSKSVSFLYDKGGADLYTQAWTYLGDNIETL